MAAPNRMLRLLQGDVGSGKTVVALVAMLDAVEAGAQAALMAPTEILARQHYATLTAARRAGRRRDRAADRPRERQAARGHPAASRLGRYRHRRRHPCAVLGRCRVQGSGARRDRRAASLRRRAAHRARRQGQGRRHPGDDGDADPAHADADRLWRSRFLAPHREAGGPQADRDAHHAADAPRRGDRGGASARSRPAPRSIGSARWSRNRS